MSGVAIRVQNLSKRYRIGLKEQQHKTLVEAMIDFAQRPMRNLRRLKSLTSFEGKNGESEDIIWALKDASFEVEPGQVVGIIGPNGAGKSTLLKILSHITYPTYGRAEIYGRVSSLLEVGTGFHSELTGRENIYLNGTILGMRKVEIDQRLDAIIDFSGVEKYIDTPVKFYSSGMRVRLAFSVAAHLQPEILLVDEVLAVGDAEFQKKCLGKMYDVSQLGRTILFVSHNMTAINTLCSRAILLKEGKIVNDGPVSEVVDHYLVSVSETSGHITWRNRESAPGNQRVKLHAIRVVSEGKVSAQVKSDRPIEIQIEYWINTPNLQVVTEFKLLDSSGIVVLESFNTDEASESPDPLFYHSLNQGLYQSVCTIPANFLNDNTYLISVMVVTLNPPVAEINVKEAVTFTVFDTGMMRTPGLSGRWFGLIRTPLAWRSKAIHLNETVL